MESYIELKNRHQSEVDEFPLFFAFDNKQFTEGMESIGLNPDDIDKIYKLGNTGGFYAKTESKRLMRMFNRHRKEMENAIRADETGDGFVYEMFRYELANHEYCATRDFESTLDALDYTVDDIVNSKKLAHGLNKAAKEIESECE